MAALSCPVVVGGADELASQSLEAPAEFPVCDGGIVGSELDPGVVRVVLGHFGPERGLRYLAVFPELESVAHSTGHLPALVGVGVALERGLKRKLIVDAVQPGRDHRG